MTTITRFVISILAFVGFWTIWLEFPQFERDHFVITVLLIYGLPILFMVAVIANEPKGRGYWKDFIIFLTRNNYEGLKMCLGFTAIAAVVAAGPLLILLLLHPPTHH